MTLPAPLHDLLNPAAYPHPCGQINVVETHISWVLLTGDYAYKLKKPVEFGFLDFSTLDKREHFCREELRCNRSFAPDLYVDVVPVWKDDGGIRIGGTPDPDNNVLEWAVQMRQFDPNAQLDRLLDHHELTLEMLAGFGAELAAHHAALPRLEVAATDIDAEIDTRIFAPVRDNFSEIAATGLQATHAELLNETDALANSLGQTLLPLIKERVQNGFIRECHGDLHLSNLVLINDTVTAFDCLEFSANLRWIDTLSDVAFLFMDCDERDRADLAYAFLNGYLDASGDYAGTRLLGYFAAYRSMVRAKVAALRWEQDHEADAEARFVKHLEWANSWLKRPTGKLILMCGLSGAGKSWLAERLAPLLPAIRLRSDVARKRLAGLSALEQSDSPIGGGLYTATQSDAVFTYLAELAGELVQSGEHVIVDATFIDKDRRAEFLTLADRLGADAHIIYCKAPVDVLRSRISERTAASNDPSEATLEVLDQQLGKFSEPATPEPVIEIATDRSLTDADFQALAEQLTGR